MAMQLQLFSALLIFSLVTPAIAQIPETIDSPRTTDEVVHQVCQFLPKQPAFTVEMDITYDALLEIDGKVQYSAYQNIVLQKPNKLRSDYVGDERVTSFYYDGQTMTMTAPNKGFYASRPAPVNTDDLVEQMDEKYGIVIPMSNLLVQDPCQLINTDVEESIYVGSDLVEREEMDHILLIGEERNIQIWVTQDEQPLLKKALITYKDLPDSPQYTVVFSDWNFSPKIDNEQFTFTPGKDDIKIEFLPIEQFQNEFQLESPTTP
ncbi:DUF2092 domain-containing protein [Synechocystis salina LEGE 06155]|nr:DUF2092 domain-containing protein [Synechocystis salina LEGE 06155]